MLDGEFDRQVGAQHSEVDAQVAALSAQRLAMADELVLVCGPQESRLGRQIGPAFQPVEQCRIVERKILFGGIDDLPDANVVFAMPQSLQAEHQRIGIREEIAEHDHDAALDEAFGEVGKERRELSVES